MEVEFEAKAIKVDKNSIREKLNQLGARLIFPERMFTRITFENKELKKRNSWIRLRDEGKLITLAFKQVTDKTSIQGMQEISIVVNNFEATQQLILQLGFEQRGFEQNLREEWSYQDLTIDLDTWPMIDPWLEIEGPNEEQVRSFFRIMDLDYSQAMFGSADIVYREIYNIDILKMKKLTFSKSQ